MGPSDAESERPADEARGRWGAVEILLALAIGFLVSMAVGVFGAETFGAGPVGGMLAMALWLGSTSVAALLLVRRKDAHGWRAMGLVAGGLAEHARSIVAGWKAYVLALPALLVVYFAWPLLARMIGVELEQQDILQSILELEGTELIIAFLLASLLNPFLEELVFRGFLQPVLIRALGPIGGIGCTSAVFALIHGISVLLPVFALSLLLGWIQFRTRRLTAAWGAHGLHNGLTLALFLYPW